MSQEKKGLVEGVLRLKAKEGLLVGHKGAVGVGDGPSEVGLAGVGPKEVSDSFVSDFGAMTPVGSHFGKVGEGRGIKGLSI